MMRTHSLAFILVLMTGFVQSCASADRVIPESLEAQVDKTVTFEQLRESPDTFKGKLVVFGGEVLKARRLKEGTQLEVLQLPLEDGQPVLLRNESQGRFLALQKEFLDPATVGDGTGVTVVGEVTGATTQRLDEMDYRYPTIEVKYLKVWEPRLLNRQPVGPRWGVYGGGGTGGVRGGVGVGIGF